MQRLPHVVGVVLLDKFCEFRCQGAPCLDHHEDLGIALDLALPQVCALDSCKQDCRGEPRSDVLNFARKNILVSIQAFPSRGRVQTWDDVDASS